MISTESINKRDLLLAGSLAAVAAVITGIIVLVYFDVLTIEGGALLVSSVLAFGTFGYVLLTFDMARTMRDEMQVQRRRARLEKKPRVLEALETEMIPLLNDLTNVRDSISGTGREVVNKEHYRSYPYPPTEFEDPMSVPRLMQTPIDHNPGDAHGFYQSLKEYRHVYGDTVHELEQLILSNLDSPPGDPEMLREYAMLAIQLGPDRIGQTNTQWDIVKDDVIPLRKEIPELIGELERLREKMRQDGTELAKELSEAVSDAMSKYEIDGSELDPESIKTEWTNEEMGRTDVYIGELPRRPNFADVEVLTEEDEDDEASEGETDTESSSTGAR